MRRAIPIAAVLLIGPFLAWAAWRALSKERTPTRIPTDGASPATDFHGKMDAPGFPPGLDWFNTDRPLALKDLRGKVVIVDFWTTDSTDCTHVLADLQKLERKYPDVLVVIGVHASKPSAEGRTDHVRQTVLQYGIEYPVVNDRDMAISRAWQVRAWPTVFVLDPDGKIVCYTSAEGIYDAFDKLIGGIVGEFDKEAKIDRRPLDVKPERDKAPALDRGDAVPPPPPGEGRGEGAPLERML